MWQPWKENWPANVTLPSDPAGVVTAKSQLCFDIRRSLTMQIMCECDECYSEFACSGLQSHVRTQVRAGHELLQGAPSPTTCGLRLALCLSAVCRWSFRRHDGYAG